MRIKRLVAKVKIIRRRRAEEKAEKEVRELALARNKALKDAERATKVATAKEELRQARVKKYRAEAPSRKEAEERHRKIKAGAKSSLKTAKGLTKRTVKGLKTIWKPIKKWAG